MTTFFLFVCVAFNVLKIVQTIDEYSKNCTFSEAEHMLYILTITGDIGRRLFHSGEYCICKLTDTVFIIFRNCRNCSRDCHGKIILKKPHNYIFI